MQLSGWRGSCLVQRFCSPMETHDDNYANLHQVQIQPHPNFQTDWCIWKKEKEMSKTNNFSNWSTHNPQTSNSSTIQKKVMFNIHTHTVAWHKFHACTHNYLLTITGKYLCLYGTVPRAQGYVLPFCKILSSVTVHSSNSHR